MRLHKHLSLVLAIALISACGKKPADSTPQGGAAAPQDGCTKIAGPNFSDFKVCYQDVDGRALFQGDIDLGSVDKLQVRGALEAHGAAALGTYYKDSYWPSNIIPYTVESGVSLTAVIHAHTDLTLRAGLIFVPRTTQADYIAYVASSDSSRCGSSPLGRQGGRQEIKLYSSCQNDRTIQHETMHSLGFWHEQARPDRDNFIRVRFENVIERFKSDFDKMPALAEGVGPYDFSSIMHYSRAAFSLNGEDTIVADTEAHNALIGQSTQASDGDIAGLKAIYASAMDVAVDPAETKVTVTFKTLLPVASRVRFGLSRSNLDQSADLAPLRTNHSVELTGLLPKTRYFYKVIQGIDLSLQPIWSTTRVFVTDSADPVLIDPRATASGDDVEFRFATNEDTVGWVAYWQLPDFSDIRVVRDRDFGKIHVLNFSVGEGTWRIAPFAADEAGNETIGNTFLYNHDSAAPVLSNIAVSNRTTSGATISWSTNEAASTVVDYGTSSGNLDTRRTGAAAALAHSVSLTGLSANTTYYYKVTSVDLGGNSTSSSVRSFSTDLSGPSISGVSHSLITGNSARITWNTNEASDSKVLYGANCANYNSAFVVSGDVTSHAVDMTGLSPTTLYCYKVVSKDPQGNETTSGAYSFITLSAPAPVLSSVASSVTSSSVTITWNSDLASSSVVIYGTSSGSYPSTASTAGNVTAHSVVISASGLEPGRTYYYKVRSASAAGTTTTSAEYSFKAIDTVTVQVTNSGYPYYYLPRYVTATTNKASFNSVTTTIKMKLIDRYTGAVLDSINMDDPSSVAGQLKEEIPFNFSYYYLYPGRGYLQFESSLGGKATWGN